MPTWVRPMVWVSSSVSRQALFRESEIQQLYDTARGHQDVRRFQVAMNDSFGVRGFERRSDLRGEPQGLSRRKSLRLFTGNNRRAVHILHDQIIRANIVNLADVGMIQRGNGFGFTLEALAELLAGNFDRDIPIQTRVLGAIHFSHAARANGAQGFRKDRVYRRQKAAWERAKSSRSQSR